MTAMATTSPSSFVTEAINNRWAVLTTDLNGAESLAAHLACPLAIAHLLIARGIATPAAAGTFFHPTIDDLHDPMLLLGMAPAVARIQQAVTTAEPILIYGDYDVDGTTATVLLKTAIERIAPKDCPAKVTYHVPHRIREGYGMQTNVLGDAALAGIRLVISVDTGIRAFAAAAEAKALGLDLIVTDHHLPDEVVGVPEALAVINPAQEACTYPFKSLCGAAVAFKLAHALLFAAATTEAERLRLKTIIVPSFLKLVAIATIADSVPLIGENRTIAALGLRELRNPVQPGLRALMQVAQIPLDRPPTETEVGFRLAPRINAAGRMDHARDVVELFLTRDAQLALDLANKLDLLNSDRRATEAQALDTIEAQLAAIKAITGEYPAECLILDDPSWHRGVVGILASRVVDRTGRPALILTHEASLLGASQAHGSGRSIEGFHLLNALTAVNQPDAVFTRFGGHAHAVGFSLPSANLGLLRDRIKSYSAPMLTVPLKVPRLVCDLEVPLDEITEDLYDWLQRCAPFGNANIEPLFASRDVTLGATPRLIKDKHICLQLERGQGRSMSALGWSRTIDWPARCTELSLAQGSVIDLAYRVRRNINPQFGGIELELFEVRLATDHVAREVKL
jgi:single-stranded-DNA-specific exonuclease